MTRRKRHDFTTKVAIHSRRKGEFMLLLLLKKESAKKSMHSEIMRV